MHQTATAAPEFAVQADEDRYAAHLVRRLQAGDTGAFDELYERYLARVYGYLRLALGNGHDAEDATQEVFARLLATIETYEVGPAPFRAWLFRVARNYALDHLARRRAEPRDPALIESLRECPLPGPEELDRFSDGELRRQLERLPEVQRQVLVLRILFDLSVDDVATLLERTAVAVRQDQHRALAFLRSRLPSINGFNGDGGGDAGVVRLPMRRRLPVPRVSQARALALVGHGRP